MKDLRTLVLILLAHVCFVYWLIPGLLAWQPYSNYIYLLFSEVWYLHLLILYININNVICLFSSFYLVCPVDVMSLSLDVWGMTTDESSSEASSAPCHQKGLPSDVPSMASDTSLPPLPASVPPTKPPCNSSVESYYLPNGDGHHAYDSADEAPDIVDEDDGLKPLKEYPRAKSAERDSDFSEESFLHRALHRRKKHEHRLAGSLESIQDSGTGSLNEDYVIKSMKQRIAELEAKLQVCVGRTSQPVVYMLFILVRCICLVYQQICGTYKSAT